MIESLVQLSMVVDNSDFSPNRLTIPFLLLLFSELQWNLISFRSNGGVILPTVLQIGETMVLQRVELEG